MSTGPTTQGAKVAADRTIRRNVVIASGITALGGLLFGYDTGVVSGALLFLQDTKSWRLMFGLAAIPAVLLFVGMLFQRESPAWLIEGLLIYTGSFGLGLGPVFWLLISEIYPLRIRGAAMSAATIANWAANFVVTTAGARAGTDRQGGRLTDVARITLSGAVAYGRRGLYRRCRRDGLSEEAVHPYRGAA